MNPDSESNPTLTQLSELKLHGMARALEEQMAMADIGELGFEERLGLLVEREATERESRRFENHLRRAKLRVPQAHEIAARSHSR